MNENRFILIRCKFSLLFTVFFICLNVILSKEQVFSSVSKHLTAFTVSVNNYLFDTKNETITIGKSQTNTTASRSITLQISVFNFEGNEERSTGDERVRSIEYQMWSVNLSRDGEGGKLRKT
jgi:hypothetical protein